MPVSKVPAHELHERSRRLAVLAARTAGPHWLGSRHQAAATFDRTDYVAGDDYRQIDWNVCARHDELRSLPILPPDNRFVYLLVDCSRSMSVADPTKFQTARRWALGLASIALAGGAVAVGAAAIAERVEAELRPVRGRRHAAALDRFFAPLAAGARATDLLSAVEDFLSRRRPTGLAIVVSDFLDPRGFAPALDRLRRARFEPLVAHVISPHDSTPEWKGAIELEDAETGARRRFVASAVDLRRYREHFARFCASMQSYCRQNQLVRLRIDTAACVDDSLRQIMRPDIWSSQFRRRA